MLSREKEGIIVACNYISSIREAHIRASDPEEKTLDEEAHQPCGRELVHLTKLHLALGKTGTV